MQIDDFLLVLIQEPIGVMASIAVAQELAEKRGSLALRIVVVD